MAAGATLAALILLAPARANGGWTAWSDEDPMDGTERTGISSAWTSPLSPMGFPYREVRAVAGIACDSGVYFRFTTAPNLSGDETRNGYNTIKLRVKFDDDPILHEPFTQDWGSDQLFPKRRSPEDELHKGLLAKNRAMLEVPWRREGKVVFRFDLAGSRNAYDTTCTEAVRRTVEEKRRAEERRGRERLAAVEQRIERRRREWEQERERREWEREHRERKALEEYIGAIQARVIANWRPEPWVPRNLHCTVKVEQSRIGEILNAEIVKSSGSRSFDRTAKQAVLRTLHLPFRPQEVPFDSEVTFVFHPEGLAPN